MKTSLVVSYNDDSDILTIDGIQYCGDCFRSINNEEPMFVSFAHTKNNVFTAYRHGPDTIEMRKQPIQ